MKGVKRATWYENQRLLDQLKSASFHRNLSKKVPELRQNPSETERLRLLPCPPIPRLYPACRSRSWHCARKYRRTVESRQRTASSGDLLLILCIGQRWVDGKTSLNHTLHCLLQIEPQHSSDCSHTRTRSIMSCQSFFSKTIKSSIRHLAINERRKFKNKVDNFS